jgi:Domain of unknown function (DUF397)
MLATPGRCPWAFESADLCPCNAVDSLSGQQLIHSMKAMNSSMSGCENESAGQIAPAAADPSIRSAMSARGPRPTVWRKSSFCQSGECVEVGAVDGMVFLRDSKAPHVGTLSYTAEEFRSFVRAIVAGEFNDLVDL